MRAKLLRDGTILALLVAPVLACGTASAAEDRTVAALGDSLSKALFSDGASPPADVPANSWSTGTSSVVNSHLRRLQALEPEAAVTGANLAVSGRLMIHLDGQAKQAVSQGADYVTILMGTNDLCEPSVAEMTSVADFESQFETALGRLESGLPDADIFVVSIPNWPRLYQTLKDNDAARLAWASYHGGVCKPVFGASTTAGDREAARQRLAAYNERLRAACGEVQSCTYDGNAFFRLPLGAPDLAPDYFHLSARGEARLAAATWSRSPARPSSVAAEGTRWNDLLLGRPTGDRIQGRSGDDRLVGAGGADRLAGGEGADVLVGGSGRDVLLGGGGKDRLVAGPGNDRIRARDGRRDRVVCGGGVDRVWADRADVVHRTCERVARR